jgi:hypothetical protein
LHIIWTIVLLHINIVVKFSNLSILYANGSKIFIIVVFINFALLITTIFIITRMVYIIHNKNTFNSLDNFLLNTLNLLILLFRTIYIIPFTIMFMVAFNTQAQKVNDLIIIVLQYLIWNIKWNNDPYCNNYIYFNVNFNIKWGTLFSPRNQSF